MTGRGDCPLNPSQMLVLDLVSCGLTNAVVAAMLGRSKSAVESELSRIYLRLGLVGRDQDKRVCAVLWWVGLLDDRGRRRRPVRDVIASL